MGTEHLNYITSNPPFSRLEGLRTAVKEVKLNLGETSGQNASWRVVGRPLSRPVFCLEFLGMLPLADGRQIKIDDNSFNRLPDLIRRGIVDERIVLQLSYERKVRGGLMHKKYDSLITAAQEHIQTYVRCVPSQADSLERRLAWTLQSPPEREGLATKHTQESTDMVRGKLIPRYGRHGLDLLSQVRLIHRAHMRGKEHIILHPNQAKKLLANELFNVDRLGGKVRSKDEFKADIGMANMTALCASHLNAPIILEYLTKVVDGLFPKGAMNPLVNENTIHYYVSAFQYYLALIHPFFEGNGRTSEDAMYALWQRRPDLTSTIRYVSNDGTRTGKDVERRMTIINGMAFDMVSTIGSVLGATNDDLKKCTNYFEVMEAVKKNFRHPHLSAENWYFTLFDSMLVQLITHDFVESPGKNPAIQVLAEQLKNVSPIYTMKDGTVLGKV